MIGSILVLATLLGQGLCQTAPPTSPVKEMFTACCIEGGNTPFAACSADMKSEDFTGFDVEAFRKVSSLLSTPWIEGVDYTFTCVPYSDIFNDLTGAGTATNNTCDVGLGGITISEPRIDAGIRFSYPTYRTSLAPLIRPKSATIDGWTFKQAFSLDLWLAIIFTVMAIPWLMFALEYLSLQGYINKSDVVPGMKEAQWRAVWTAYNMEPFNVSSMAARVLSVAFGVVAVVYKEVLQSNLAAQLTINSLKIDITSPEDLVGKAIVTLPIYEQGLKTFYGLQPTTEDLTAETQEDWVTRLRSGALTAVVIDEPLMQYLANSEGCDLRVAAVPMVDFDLGFAFAADTEDQILEEFSRAILYSQEDGTLSQLRTSFIDVVNPDCVGDLQGSGSVSMNNVYGLWILIAASIVLAFITVSVGMYLKARKATKKKYARKKALEAAAARSTMETLRFAAEQKQAETSTGPAPSDAAMAQGGFPVVSNDGTGDLMRVDTSQNYGDIFELHSISSMDSDDEGDGDDDDNAHPPARLHHLPVMGVAFKQKISMFGLHLAYNKEVLKYLDTHPITEDDGDEEAAVFHEAISEPFGMQLVHQLRSMCEDLEASTGLQPNGGGMSNAGTSRQERPSSQQSTLAHAPSGQDRVIDEGLSEASVMRDYGYGGRPRQSSRMHTVDDTGDE